MPQKKNPDVAELTRGKSGRVIGNLVSLLVLLKGLPMTYNRDLQEDKERLFDTADTVRACTKLMTGMIGATTVNAGNCSRASEDPSLLATDLADYLVKKGLPFRQAHHLVGSLVALAEKKKKTLAQLSTAEYRSIDPHFDTDIKEIFDLKKALASRNLPGAPGTAEVKKQLERWDEALRPAREK